MNAKKAEIPQPLSPRQLRHACATHLLKGGADVRHIQKLLGHASLDMTAIYTRVAPVDLAKAIAHGRTTGGPRSRIALAMASLLSALLLSVGLGSVVAPPPALPTISAAVPPSSLADSLAAPAFAPSAADPHLAVPYFGARYYGSKIGRFTTIDPVYTWQENLVDPQRWNRYAYARNNPLRYVDPDGRAIETPWDVLNVGIGLASFGANVAAGNVGGAVVDAIGIAYDATATAVPVLPGGAGTLIKGIRGADKVADLVRAGDKAADVAKVARGGETAATKAGREAHRKFAEKVRAKADEGWQSEPTMKGPHGETLRPDAITPSGRPVEIKPNTPSGHRRGAAQIKKYEEATGKKGRVVYYDR